MSWNFTENFDSSGSLPTDFVYNSAGWAISTAHAHSSPNSLTWATLNTTAAAGTALPDASSGNVILSAWVYVPGSPVQYQEAFISVRSADQVGTTTSYGLKIAVGSGDSPAGLSLVRNVSSSGTTIGTPVGSQSTFPAGWYQMVLTANGSTITAQVQDAAGNYLNSSGSFVAGTQTAITATDSVITGSGYATLGGYVSTSGPAFYYDDASFQTSAVGATSFSLTGPSSGIAGVASANFTVTPNGTTTGTFTPNAVAGCTFNPATLSWSGTSAAQTFTVTRSGAGSASIDGTFSNSLTPPAAITYTAYSVTLTPSSQSVADAVAASLTATLAGGSGSLAATTTGGSLSTGTPTSGTAFTLTAQSSGSGTDTVTVTHPASGASATATVAYSAAAATAITLAGPTAVAVGSPATYTVAANGSLSSSVVVTPADAGGGSLSPTTITLTSGAPSATFAVTRSAAGSGAVSIINNASLADSGSPITLTAAVAITYDSLAGGLPSGYASSAVVTPQAWNGSTLATANGAIASAVVETAQAGTYLCRVAYPASTLPAGTIPVVAWAAGGQGVTDPSPLPVAGPVVSLSLTQTLAAPRALDAVADAAITTNDALWCATAYAAGKGSQVGTAFTVKTPSTGTAIRNFTLDSATAPTQRS